MFRKFSFTLLLLMLFFSAFTQGLETLSIKIIDQNNDLVSVGIVSLADSNRKKVIEAKLEDTKKIRNINLSVGTYTIEIQAVGFKPYQKSIEINAGQNNLEIQLEVEEIKVNVEIDRSEQEKRLDEVIGGYLTKKEIDSLPEKGEDIKEELKRRYGDDILIRIDGDFEGSQVPSKAEISSIKIIRNSFDAEFHEAGRTIVDIRTNGIADGFHGFVNFNLNNSILNARNPFAPKRQPTRANNLIFLFSGPLIKKKTSFSLATLVFDRANTQNFIGTGFTGTSPTPQKIGNRLALTTFRIKHNLPKSHTLNFKYQNIGLKFSNFGLSSFDLPERGSTRNNVEHKFTLTESGTFKNKYANDLTLEFSTGTEKTVPKSDELTILVLSNFNRGSSGIRNRVDRNKFKFADVLLFDRKQHSLKIGTEIEYERLRNSSANNINGTFTFLNLADFTNQRPTQFSQTLGKTNFSLNQFRIAFFVQDDFKASKTLQLSLGLRYEQQNNVADYNNFSPRFGYVWSPEKSGKFIVRGGIGVFYDWLDAQNISAILSNDGRQGQKIIIRNPSFPNPFIGGGTSQQLPNSISRLAENLSAPYIFVSQNAFNYKASKTVTFEGIYTFKKSLHNFRSRNINAPINGIRPNPNFGVIQLLESSGNSTENTFELKINGYYKGVNMYANYELGRDISDFSSSLALPSDNNNLSLDRGFSNLDQRHKFNFSFNYEFLKKFTVSPSFRLESGFPYTITTGRDDNGDTVFNDRPNNIQRNTERGESIKQFDLQFRWKLPKKYFGIKETDNRKNLGLNTNIRNLFNTANLTNYVGVQTSPFFRQATSARNARSIEVGMSFTF
jgi:TonB dependent receptor